MSTTDATEPVDLRVTPSLRPLRFKITSGRFLKSITLPIIPGEVGTTIDVKLHPDARREGWDDWVGVTCEGSLIGWVSADGDNTRALLRAFRDAGYEVVATAGFESANGERTLRIQVPKHDAMTAWLEWRRPTAQAGWFGN